MWKNTSKRGLTLIKDEPVWIEADYTISGDYNGEKASSITAGIDGSLWCLLYNATAQPGDEQQVAKWQTITKKWYKVGEAKGVNLSAYNEISLSLVKGNGLLQLSSATASQENATYTDGTTAAAP